VILCGLRQPIRDTLEKTGVLAQLQEGQVAASRLQALQSARGFLAAA